MTVPTSPMRDDLVQELNKYMSNGYGKGKVLYNLNQMDDNGEHMIIEISVHNDKLESFWSGEWLSVWELKDG